MTLTGRIIDFNARPVEGATVVCYKSVYEMNQCSFEPLGQALTTSDGRFSLQVETEDSSPLLVAGKQGLALGWREIYRGSEPTIRLGRPSQFKGTVVDPAGRPVPGAKVRICLKNKMITRREITPLLPEGWFTTKTDANGRFLFNNIPEGATADFGAEAPGRASIWTTCDFGLLEGEQFVAGRTDISIILPPEARIKGQVVDEHTGQALAGVRILAKPTGHAKWKYYQDRVYSDPNGRFEFTGLAPDTYLLCAISPKEGAGNLTVTVESGQAVSDVRITLAKGVPFEVMVSNLEKAGPVEDATVTVTQRATTPRYTTFGQTVLTDSNGLARLFVPSGECEVQVIKPGHGVTFVPLQFVAGQTVRHELFLPRRARSLSGKVLDEQGHVIPGVSVLDQAFGLALSTITDANGQFDMSYYSGRSHPVRILARHSSSGLGAIAELLDPTKSSRFHGRITLKPAYVLIGHVTDPTGKSIPAANVKLLLAKRITDVTGAHSRPVTEVTTDANGVYCIRSVPPPGNRLKYAIAAWAEGFGLTMVSKIPVHENTAEPVQLDPIVLLLADQVISGVVEDSNGQPVIGALVSVNSSRYSSSFRELPRRKTLTGPQGRFRIAGVCEEPLVIYAMSPWGLKHRGLTSAYGGNENVKVVLGQKLIFSPSLIGKPLPDLKDLKVDLSPADTDDKMLLVCFWDMQQRPSRNCIRELAKRAEELKEKGVAVIAVQASKIDENELNEWVKNYNIPFPVGMVQGDGEKTRFDWGVKSLPWLILTDRKHIVRAEGFALTELDEKISAISQKQN